MKSIRKGHSVTLVDQVTHEEFLGSVTSVDEFTSEVHIEYMNHGEKKLKYGYPRHMRSVGNHLYMPL